MEKKKAKGCLICPNSMAMAGAGSMSADATNVMPAVIHGVQAAANAPAPMPGPAQAPAPTGMTESMKKESSIDFPASEGLCPDIWDNAGTKWVMKEEIKQYALELVDRISAKYQVHPTGVNIVGSICSNQYKPDADVDVHIQVNMSKEAADSLNNIWWMEKKMFLAGIDLFVGTPGKTHPLEFYFQSNIYADMGSCGCYDLMKDEWLAEPQIVDIDFDPFDEYAGSFDEAFGFGKDVSEALFELHKDMYQTLCIFHWGRLKEVYSNEQMESIKEHRLEEMDEKLKEDIKGISEIYDEMMKVRRRTGINPTNKEEAEKMRTDMEWLAANSTYKFLQQLGVIESCKNISILNEAISGTDATVEEYFGHLQKAVMGNRLR